MKKFKTFLYKICTFGLLVCAVFILIISSVKLYQYNKERGENERLAKEVTSQSLTQQVAPINIDFEKLRHENKDVIAWLYCEGTPINYPIVQTKDNFYYLRKGTDGEYSLAGTLFADYRNKGDFTDNNTIIYGHNMKNDTMFGTLTDYKNQKYFDEHPYMYILTKDAQYKIKLISGVTLSSTASIYRLPLKDNDKEVYISELLKKSTFKAEYSFSHNDRFVTLSTCSYDYDDARYVLLGLLEAL